MSPRSLNEALKGSDKDEWAAALNQEYDSLLENKTWQVMKLPPERKALPCHWDSQSSTMPMGLLRDTRYG